MRTREKRFGLQIGLAVAENADTVAKDLFEAGLDEAALATRSRGD